MDPWLIFLIVVGAIILIYICYHYFWTIPHELKTANQQIRELRLLLQKRYCVLEEKEKNYIKHHILCDVRTGDWQQSRSAIADCNDPVSIANRLINKYDEYIDRLTLEAASIKNSCEDMVSRLDTRVSQLNEISLHLISPEYEALSFFGRAILEQKLSQFPLPRELLASNIGKEERTTRFTNYLCSILERTYKYDFLCFLNPEIDKQIDQEYINRNSSDTSIIKKAKLFFDYASMRDTNKGLFILEKVESKTKNDLFDKSKSNLTAIPYMAAIIADYETIDFERIARALDWGSDKQRLKKVQSIREIRSEAKRLIEENLVAKYQLQYLFELYPVLQDVVECEFNKLPQAEFSELGERDPVHDYLSKEEYEKLSSVERNQLALDRYVSSHNKSKWQIGRDYELYVGYQWSKKGCTVDYFGSYMGLEDLGRDLIVKQPDGNILIIQCKYWSNLKEIHEKHITQLYGTIASYCIENNVSPEKVEGMLVTNIELSSMAKKMADYLSIKYQENVLLGDYPRIKCNIGRDEYGCETKIYHLPFDQQYDTTKIDSPGEMFAMTVAEAEKAGFRRAYRWFGE